MPLTHDFKETIQARAQTDQKFRQALLREAVESYLNGDLETGKAVLRDYVNATVGFQASAANLSGILTALQKTEGIHFELSLR